MSKTNTYWDQIFAAKDFDLTEDVHYITAKEIKAITNYEARLLAKMDARRDLPTVMASNGYVLLPVSNGTYAIVRGNGFHELEAVGHKLAYESKIQFSLSTIDRNTSEMQYLDYAAMSGLIEHVVGRGTLYSSIRGREGSGSFSFDINGHRLDVNKAQIEVDLGLEGRDCIVLLEAKSKVTEDFITRQLYYPYRRFLNLNSNKAVIPIFFVYDANLQTYNFWIYAFRQLESYNSIELVKTVSYSIATRQIVSINDIQPVELAKTNTVPQADSLDKILELVFKVSEGITTAKGIAEYFEFAGRQGNYYIDAARTLGLIEADGNHEFRLTQNGQQLVALDTQARNIYFAKTLSSYTLISTMLQAISEGMTLSKKDIERFVTRDSNLSGSTIPRRSQTLYAWLLWIAQHTGTIIAHEGIVYSPDTYSKH